MKQETEINVGDKVLGSFNWKGVIAEVLFVSPNGLSIDIMLPNGEQASVSTQFFKKVTR